ncbi:MAG: isochorismatase family protein, partial [Candidatus Alcyoniella australis]|nr:isochorismatase family protein [Candidatus Alcyoniella australis]
LVIDYQQKLFPHVLDWDQIERRALFAIECLRRLELPMVVSEQYPRGLGPTLPSIQQALGEAYRPLSKTTFSCLADADLARAVADTGAKTLLVIGIETHICVAQTVLEALEHYRVHVLADAVGARAQIDHRLGLERMARSGAIITTAEGAVYELLREAKTPEHKRLFELLK